MRDPLGESVVVVIRHWRREERHVVDSYVHLADLARELMFADLQKAQMIPQHTETDGSFVEVSEGNLKKVYRTSG